MYEHLHPKQKANLIYGSKLRAAKCLRSNAQAGNRFGMVTFTREELNQLERISENACDRAKKDYETEIRRLDTTVTAAEVSGGSETEHRQYNGK